MTSIAIDRNDGLSSAVAIKAPCRVVTSANITLSGLQTIDGVSLAANDRVLVRSQTSAVDNGIWIVDTGPWRRSKDFAGNRDVRLGTQIYVTSGTTYSASGWYVNTANPIVIGTTALTISQNVMLNAAQLIALEASATAAAASATASAAASLVSENNAAAWAAGVNLPAVAANRLLIDNALGTLRESVAFPDALVRLGFNQCYLLFYGVSAANSAAANTTAIQARLDVEPDGTHFIFPPGLVQFTTLKVWKNGHKLPGDARTTLYSSSPRAIKFIGNLNGVACPDLLEEYWDTGDTSNWNTGGGTAIPVVGGKLTGTGTFRFYRDFTVPVGVPVQMGSVISAGSGVAMRIYDAAGTGDPFMEPLGTATISNASPAVITRTGHGLAANAPLKLTTAGALPAGLVRDARAAVTISIASPGVITWTGHNLPADTPIKFATNGTLPTGLVAGTTYYLKTVLGANTFTVSATVGGAAINTTGTQTSTHAAGTISLYYVKTVLDANTFTVSTTPGGTEVNTSSAGSGTHTINSVLDVLTTDRMNPGWVTSLHGTIRVTLYSAGSVTCTVDFVNARVAGTSYRQGISGFQVQQPGGATYPFIYTGSVEDCTIDGLVCLSIGQLIVMGDATSRSAYINLYNTRGIGTQNVGIPMVLGRNGVNCYMDRTTVRVGLYSNTVAGRNLMNVEATWPMLWDEWVITRTDTSGWYDAVNLTIRMGPNGGTERTAIGPFLGFSNVFDSNRRSIMRCDVGAGCYIKELTFGAGDTSSCFEGDAFVLTGAGLAIAPIIGGGGTMRTRSVGRSGMLVDIGTMSGASFGGTFHDLDIGRYGNAACLTLTGNSNWDGVQVDGFVVANANYNNPDNGALPRMPAYGLVVDGASAIKNLIVTPNNRFVGTTLKVSLNTPPEGATSLIASNVVLNKSSGAVTVTASPMTIAAVAWNRSVKVGGGTVSRIDVGPAASWYTTTDHDFFLPAGQTAAVTYTVAPTITVINW